MSKTAHSISRVASMWLEARDAWLESVFDNPRMAKQTRLAGKMDYQAVFMMGAPGAGKSTVKDSMYLLKHTGFKNLDSDEYKKEHPQYLDENPGGPGGIIHLYSLDRQREEFFKTLPTGEPFIYDGTGANPAPVIQRMTEAKKAGYRIFLVYVYVPPEISLFRNRNRQRFVPEGGSEGAMAKAKIMDKSFGALKQHADKFKVVLNYSNDELARAKADMEMYPPPQAARPPRPGSPDYGQ